MHRCKVSQVIKFESNFHRMSDHARCIISPADPFVPWNKIFKKKLRPMDISSIIGPHKWFYSENLQIGDLTASKTTATFIKHWNWGWNGISNANRVPTMLLLCDARVRETHSHLPPITLFSLSLSAAFVSTMEFEKSFAILRAPRGSEHQRTRVLQLAESRNNQHKGKLTTPYLCHASPDSQFA